MMLAYDRKTVGLEDIEMAYLDSGDGASVVFLHGTLANAAQFGPILDSLPASRRHIVVDLMGHGFTQISPDQPLGMDAQAEAVRQLVDRLGLGPVHLVGSGSGGGVAQVFAIDFPWLVRSLVLTDCDVRDITSAAAFESFTRALERVGARRHLMNLIENPELARGDLCLGPMVEDPANLPDDMIRHFLVPLAETERRARNFHRYLTSNTGAHTVEAGQKMGQIGAPTTLIWGSGDTKFPITSALWLIQRVGDPRMLHVIPNARCYLHLDHPRTLAQLFDNAFLEAEQHNPPPDFADTKN